MRSKLSGVQIPTAAKLNIDGEFTLDASAGTSGQLMISNGAGVTPSWTSSPDLLNPLLTSVSTIGGGGAEGGQINFARVSDGAQYWYIDSYGTGGTPTSSAPDLRFIENTTQRLRLGSGGTIDITNNTALVGGASVDLLNTTTTTLNFAGAALNLAIAGSTMSTGTRTINIGYGSVSTATQNINIGASSMTTAAQTISIGTNYSGSTTNITGTIAMTGPTTLKPTLAATNPGTGIVLAPHMVFSQADSGNSTNTTVNVFASANDVLSSLEPATLYRFRAKYYSSLTYGGTAGAINILFAFSNAPAAIRYSFKTYPQVAGTTITQLGASAVTTATTIVPSQSATGAWVTEIDGYIKTHATLASTLTPQFINTASVSTTALMQSGSTFEIERLTGSSTSIVAGNWA